MVEGNYRKPQSLHLKMTVQTVLFIQCVSLGMARRRYETGRSQVHKSSTAYLHELSPWDSIHPIEKGWSSELFWDSSCSGTKGVPCYLIASQQMLFFAKELSQDLLCWAFII